MDKLVSHRTFTLNNKKTFFFLLDFPVFQIFLVFSLGQQNYLSLEKEKRCNMTSTHTLMVANLTGLQNHLLKNKRDKGLIFVESDFLRSAHSVLFSLLNPNL